MGITHMADEKPVDDGNPGKFTLGLEKEVDEAAPPPPPEAYSKDRRRISAVFYALLAIIIVGMIAAYFDLSRRVNRSQSVGTNQIDNLENRLLTLFDKFTVLEKQLDQKITADQEAFKEEIVSQLNKAKEAVSTTNKKLSDKASQSEMNTAIAALKKEVTQTGTQTDESLKSINDLKKRLEEIKILNAGLKKLETRLTAAQDNLTGEINEITLQIDQSSKNLIELRSKADQLATDKIDREGATRLIKKHLQMGQPASKQVSKTLSDHQTKIDSLNRQIITLQQDADIYIKEILKIKKQLKAGPPAVSGQNSQLSPPRGASISSATPAANPGDLLQQSLKE